MHAIVCLVFQCRLQITVGTSNFVLAYMPETSQESGPALYADGSARRITAVDLQTALENQKDIKPGGLARESRE